MRKNNVEVGMTLLGAFGVGTMLVFGNIINDGYKKAEDLPKIERVIDYLGIYAIRDFLDLNDDGQVKEDEVNKFYKYMSLDSKERSLESFTADEWYSYIKHTGRRIR
jgi:hypothetical protein